ncbi:type I 3-dehydroquinate dehydratase [Brachybacterium huguangmaarense]
MTDPGRGAGGSGGSEGIVRVRGVELGRGHPAIIVPLTAPDLPGLLAGAAAAARHGSVDLVEWRLDAFAPDIVDARDHRDAVLDAAPALREALGELPVVVTFRTRAEGGLRAISDDDYLDLLTALSAAGAADLLDVEAGRGADAVRAAIDAAHAAGIPVVASHHDFGATPPEAEILARLRALRDLGAEIAKIAVTPRTPADVLALLGATRAMRDEDPGTVLITMSMGALGAVSRIAGETFGSAATFGTLGAASAPGQLPVEVLAPMLEALALDD